MSEAKKKKETKDGVATAVEALGPQMGSDLSHLKAQKIDQRKFAVLNEPCQAAMGHFYYRAMVDEVRYYDWMLAWELNTTPSIGGLGRRQVIQTVAAAAGAGKGVFEVADRPNILARNITRRDWREKATREGKLVNE